MPRRGKASEVVDLVDFHVQREGHVVPHQLEARLGQQVVHVVPGARAEVVHREQVMAEVEETTPKM
jgi:hypothetical protein